MDHQVKFTREDPEVRKSDLIQATIRCLSERGVAGTSVREVASRAGVSAGLIRHYFGGIDQLVLATYEHVGRLVESAMDKAVSDAGEDPEDRLAAYLASSFKEPVLDTSLLATWIAYWSLVQTNDEVHKLHSKLYAEARAKLEGLLSSVATKKGKTIDTRKAALRLSALVDGLWLEICLDPSIFTPEEATEITLDCANAILG